MPGSPRIAKGLPPNFLLPCDAEELTHLVSAAGLKLKDGYLIGTCSQHAKAAVRSFATKYQKETWRAWQKARAAAKKPTKDEVPAGTPGRAADKVTAHQLNGVPDETPGDMGTGWDPPSTDTVPLMTPISVSKPDERNT